MKELTLKESQGVNLCDLTYSVNGGLKLIDGKEEFIIERPTALNITITGKQKEEITKLLELKGVCYDLYFYPPHYFKNQTSKMYSLALEFGYLWKKPTFKVIEFGCSYGKIEIDGSVMGLSHSGGSGADYTNKFNLQGLSKELKDVPYKTMIKLIEAYFSN